MNDPNRDLSEELREFGTQAQERFHSQTDGYLVQDALHPTNPTQRTRLPRFIKRVAFVAATLVLGIGSVAWASNGAVPGDALYGIDIAIEGAQDALGLGSPNSRAEERLDEANALVGTDTVRAIEALKSAIDELGNPGIEDLDTKLASIQTIAGTVLSEPAESSGRQTALLADEVDQLFSSGLSNAQLVDELSQIFTQGPTPQVDPTRPNQP